MTTYCFTLQHSSVKISAQHYLKTLHIGRSMNILGWIRHYYYCKLCPIHAKVEKFVVG